MNLTFSQRIGMSPVSEVKVQTESMDERLRTFLWNAFYLFVYKDYYSAFFKYGEADRRDYLLWIDVFAGRIDEQPGGKHIQETIKWIFQKGEWFYVYDFIDEFYKKVIRVICTDFHEDIYVSDINEALEKGNSGYRFISGIFSPITSQTEISEIEAAANDDQYSGASFHISEALRMLSDKQNPDYRNSIKESISAVESVAKTITGKPNANLGDALKELERNKNMHSGLRKGFDGLYGYTNDKENGIRHAYLDDKTEITIADAQYFLVSCSAFVNYLKTLNVKDS